MALNYTITHNGNSWTSTTPLDSVSISNGSATTSITTAGTTTLNCAGKVAANNLVIGDKTLNCKDKIMAGNVTVTTEESAWKLKCTEYSITGAYSTSNSSYLEDLQLFTCADISYGKMYWSTNGIDWTAGTVTAYSGEIPYRARFPKVRKCGNKYYGFTSNTEYGELETYISTDGKNWTYYAYTTEANYPIYYNMYKDGKFWGNYKGHSSYYYSTDGTSWTKATLGSTKYVDHITYNTNSNKYVALAGYYAGTWQNHTSSTGMPNTWTTTALDSDRFHGVWIGLGLDRPIIVDGVHYYRGNGGMLATSDFINWKYYNLYEKHGSDFLMVDNMAYAHGRFICTSMYASYIGISEDGFDTMTLTSRADAGTSMGYGEVIYIPSLNKFYFTDAYGKVAFADAGSDE